MFNVCNVTDDVNELNHHAEEEERVLWCVVKEIPQVGQ